MNKKRFIVVLLVIALFSLNFCVAHEIDNSTSEDSNAPIDNNVLSINAVNDTVLKASNADTQISVQSDTNFDAIGEYFKVKLADSNGKALTGTKVTFTVSGKTYNQNTDNNGIASLQLRLNDGTYTITTKFAGNTNYNPSSLTTTVTMTNTRVVEEGLSNSEIQKIIDNAKSNNVILFKGSSYSDINLVITKSLTLISDVNTVLKSDSGAVITIKGKGASLATVKGFNIQSGGDGIAVNGADYVKILKNDISGKGNGIVAIGTNYLNITKNDITKNSKAGISLADSRNAYIFDNDIKSNAGNGIEIAKSGNVYVHGNIISGNSKNGIYLGKTVNDVKYGEGPNNLHINKNAVRSNKGDGILIENAGDNVNIKSNSIESNNGNGISIAHVGDNKIQSNVIYENAIGIKFFDNYVKPANQDISSNAILDNKDRDLEAKETYYQDNGVRLDVGDNWYSDLNLVCPKIKTNNLRFSVTQIGPNKFQAQFLDTNGNVASLLPDRTLTYTTNGGQTVSITISGGAGVFTVDANDGDLIRATVDRSDRDNTYNSNAKTVNEIKGQTPTYSYPEIPNYELYEDIGSGNGNGNGGGTGEGSGGNANRGNGVSSSDSSSNGNSTHSQKSDPSNSANNQVNDVSQSYETQSDPSQASASNEGASSAGSQPESVVKQIIMDEDDFFRVTGISFIVLLMIFTVGFYYRDDIKEMNSKR